MGIWPLLLVALFAGLMGLLELDWTRFFADPAREALRELWTEAQGWRDLDARIRVWGMGQEPVRMRVRALLDEGAFRLELLEPEGLRGQVFTYRKGMLVHYRPGDGGLRIVHVLGEEGAIPSIHLRPQDLEIALEGPEPLGTGWEGFRASSLGLQGIAGTPAPRPSLAFSPFTSAIPGFRRLRITGLPEPMGEIVIWLDDAGRIRGGSVTVGAARITVQIEELRPNQGLDLLELLRLPRAERTLWYEEAQSM